MSDKHNAHHALLDLLESEGDEWAWLVRKLKARAENAEADRTALMEVVRAARKAIQLAKSPSTGGHSDYRDGYDHAWREVHDLLAGPVDALPDHLKDETKD